MAGTYIIRTAIMQSATGGFTLTANPVYPSIDGATANSNGTVQMPFPVNCIYLDGASSPTPIASLPLEWTPNDAYTFHHMTSCAAGGDSASYNVSGLGIIATFNGPFNIGGSPVDQARTGMTLAGVVALSGAIATITATVSVSVSVQNKDFTDDPVNGWDAVINTSFVGTYTTVTPTVTSVTPPAGTVNGGVAVTIRGKGFTAGTAAKFDGVLATDFVVLNDTTATAVTPEHVSGMVNVEVVGVATGTALYTYVIPTPQLPPMPSRTPMTQGGVKRG